MRRGRFTEWDWSQLAGASPSISARFKTETLCLSGLYRSIATPRIHGYFIFGGWGNGEMGVTAIAMNFSGFQSSRWLPESPSPSRPRAVSFSCRANPPRGCPIAEMPIRWLVGGGTGTLPLQNDDFPENETALWKLQVICYDLITHEDSIAQISVNEKSSEVENFIGDSIDDRPVHSLLNSSC